MILIENSSTLPEPQPGWKVRGRTKRDEVLPLGEYPRPTLGERLLGKYHQFHRINLAEQQISFECKARSATGELYFRVNFEIEFRVQETRATELLAMDNPVRDLLKSRIMREAQDISEAFAAEDDRAFQDQLRSALDPRRGALLSTGPFELLRVDLRVMVPEGVRAREEISQLLKDMDARIPLAEVEGDSALSGRLRKGRDSLREAMVPKGEDGLSNAQRARRMQVIIDQLIDSGRNPSDDIIKSLQAKQQGFLKNAVSKVAPELSRDKPHRQVAEDDPEDTN